MTSRKPSNYGKLSSISTVAQLLSGLGQFWLSMRMVLNKTKAQREEIATKETSAMLMIHGADPTNYGTLVAELSNQFVKGKDEYPKNMSSTATMPELY